LLFFVYQIYSMKTFKTLILSFFLLISAITGCTFTTSRLNREEDKAAAEKVTKKLFGLLKAKNYDATFNLYSDSLWVNTTKEKLKNIYSYTDGKLGDMKSDSLASWQTKVVSGTDPWAKYELIYQNQYEKGPAVVEIVLIKEPDGKIKILGYHVKSDLFLAK
jgi:hypothetical protein